VVQQDAGRISEYMVFGLMVYGLWFMVYGLWLQEDAGRLSDFVRAKHKMRCANICTASPST
jgi:hypothetical protein